mmetsp:Transcript_20678/g.54878  ORF Transcript_20678/g.54878 Transcript_20678/m.54878 type:complete len:100 (+) Transcript_20678:461-760(+)
MAKGDVLGANMHPVWKMMKEAARAPDPRWNFQGRFVIGRSGSIKCVPSSVDVETVVDEALAEPRLRIGRSGERAASFFCLACLDYHAILRLRERMTRRV